VANFKTGTRVKRLQRAGALRPLAGKNPSETYYVTTDKMDFRCTGSSQRNDRGRALFALVGRKSGSSPSAVLPVHMEAEVERAEDGRHIKMNGSLYSEVSESSGYLDMSAEN